MSYNIVQLQVGKMANFCYLVWDTNSSIGVVIDPSWNLEKILDIIQSKSLSISYIINTHSHFDHILGNEQLAEITKAKIIQHSSSPEYHDLEINEGSEISIGSTILNVIHTPGHSDDSVCLLIKDECIFTGDTLFVGNCGRTDLPGGSSELLYHSLQRLKNLTDNLIVYPGHHYGQTPTSSIGSEKASNPVLFPNTLTEFIHFMGHG